jgi:hypothetical protein
MSQANRMKCAFCEKTFARWRTNRKGRRVNGYEALRDHCAEEHLDQPAVQNLLYVNTEDSHADSA